MFNNLANYLLGTTSNQQDEASKVEGETNIRLKSVESDDDWVLVDRDSEGNSELSSEESECEPSLTDVDQLHTRPISRSSSLSSLQCLHTVEESWFLTPPPCFISTGPVHMETSPLENLLIEHPSMSVYQQPNTGLLRRHASLEAFEDEEEIIEEEIDDFLQVQAIPQGPRRIRVHDIKQQERQGDRRKKAQKVQIQKACQSLKRGYLERNNKAREVNCRNQRLRRCERSQGATRSYVSNNRKC